MQKLSSKAQYAIVTRYTYPEYIVQGYAAAFAVIDACVMLRFITTLCASLIHAAKVCVCQCCRWFVDDAAQCVAALIPTLASSVQACDV
jgi:hypothetical protein